MARPGGTRGVRLPSETASTAAPGPRVIAAPRAPHPRVRAQRGQVSAHAERSPASREHEGTEKITTTRRRSTRERGPRAPESRARCRRRFEDAPAGARAAGENAHRTPPLTSSRSGEGVGRALPIALIAETVEGTCMTPRAAAQERAAEAFPAATQPTLRGCDPVPSVLVATPKRIVARYSFECSPR